MGQELLREFEAAALKAFPKPVKTAKKKPSAVQNKENGKKPKRKSKGMAGMLKMNYETTLVMS